MRRSCAVPCGSALECASTPRSCFWLTYSFVLRTCRREGVVRGLPKRLGSQRSCVMSMITRGSRSPPPNRCNGGHDSTDDQQPRTAPRNAETRETRTARDKYERRHRAADDKKNGHPPRGRVAVAWRFSTVFDLCHVSLHSCGGIAAGDANFAARKLSDRNPPAVYVLKRAPESSSSRCRRQPQQLSSCPVLALVTAPKNASDRLG